MAKAKKAGKPALKFPKTGKAKAAAPKAAKKAAPKAAKVSNLSAAAAKAAKQAKHATPKTKPLPGFEQVVDARLNDICGRISDNRAAANDLRQEIEADSQAALDHMLRTKRQTYHHAGVELVVRPGAAKLSVRTFKEEGATANLPAVDGDGDDEAASEVTAKDAMEAAAAGIDIDIDPADDAVTH